MFVVGTAGHIDHGKTLLIKALTGIDCDRLPEEKEREMTIDIGFARMELPGTAPVSVIDVPGHERFIRNMVAGAWGIDLGLLVVAADDGWMPQTEDHFRVLQLLGVGRVIAVINKIDIADSETVEMVTADIKSKLALSSYRDAAIVPVSAKRGDGIDKLKSAIAVEIGKLSASLDSGKPYLFIDRVFTMKGHGTVVTGTQKNGSFDGTDTVTLLPRNLAARIKRIESHHQAGVSAGSARIALNLSGIAPEQAARGDIVVRKNFFTATDDFIGTLHIAAAGGQYKKNQGIEILIGTAGIPGKIITAVDTKNEVLSIARIRLDSPWPVYPGQRYVVTRTGGFRIYGGGMVLLPAYDKGAHKSAVKNAAHLMQNYELTDILGFIITVHKKIEKDTLASMFPFKAEVVSEALDKLIKNGTARSMGPYVIASALASTLLDSVKKSIDGSAGINLKELSDRTGFDQELCRIIMLGMIKSGSAVERDGRYFPENATSAGDLPDHLKKILSSALAGGIDGIAPGTAKNEKEKSAVRELIGLGFLVSLEGELLWHRDIYNEMQAKIVRLLDEKNKITIADARDATGLSRKYLIPLLNRIERDGLVKRLGDFRVKP